MSAPQQPEPATPDRRALVLGVAVGALVPGLAFPLGLFVARELEGSLLYSLGSAVWALVAFVGVLLLGFDRTRRLGLGILLGFTGLIVVGAGACTAVVMGGSL